MTTPTDFRALCAELVKQLEGWQCYASPDGPNAEVLTRARAALAQPEPVGDRVAELEAELERERLRLAACGVVAMADTPEAAAKARDMHLDYWSASLDDVIRQVDALMELRSKLAQPEPEFTAEEVEMVQAPWSYLAPAQPDPNASAPDVALERIAEIARAGALIGFGTETEALIEIRRLTQPFVGDRINRLQTTDTTNTP